MTHASRRRAPKYPELPKPSIESVLRELGATDIPTGFGWVRMHCFAHTDRTASASVNHDIDGYTCKSCQLKGDGLKVLQLGLGLTFQEAVERAKALDPGSSTSTTRQAPRRRRASDLL